MNGPDAGPFRWFWAEVIRKPCPSCHRPTAVGFDRADPGAAGRVPSTCTGCTGIKIENANQFSRGQIGYPLSEQGPCANCRQPTRLYGPHGRPVCDSCAETSTRPPAPEPRTAAIPPLAEIPAPRSPEPDPEPELSLF